MADIGEDAGIEILVCRCVGGREGHRNRMCPEYSVSYVPERATVRSQDFVDRLAADFAMRRSYGV